MASPKLPGGTFVLADDLELTRVGYGAMQLAGPHVFGPPADRGEAIGVLREVIELGINHIDTSDYYGPHITNQIIKEALHPYPASLRIVTKVGARRDAEGGWSHALAPDELRQAVHDNLENLGLDALDVVNLRVGGLDAPTEGSIAEPFSALAEMRQEGLIKHLGISTVNAEQIAEAQSIAPIVCVQNFYNVAHRSDDALIDSLAEQGIAYVPYFPLGGFTPLQSDALSSVAARLGASPLAVALAWLLERAPNILLIPGTSSVTHLHENVRAAGLAMPDDALIELEAIVGRTFRLPRAAGLAELPASLPRSRTGPVTTALFCVSPPRTIASAGASSQLGRQRDVCRRTRRISHEHRAGPGTRRRS